MVTLMLILLSSFLRRKTCIFVIEGNDRLDNGEMVYLKSMQGRQGGKGQDMAHLYMTVWYYERNAMMVIIYIFQGLENALMGSDRQLV